MKSWSFRGECAVFKSKVKIMTVRVDSIYILHPQYKCAGETLQKVTAYCFGKLLSQT